ncbi:MAG: thioredoxin family protein [Lactobacillus sp.]|nr:thioredoxin family protein [Lactobacillus sp.]
MKDYQKLTPEEFKDVVKSGCTVVEFSAEWCGDCKFLEPFLPEIEASFPKAQFVKIDRDGALDLAIELGIMGIPSFLVYQDGQEIGRLVNKDRKTKEEVIDFIKSVD